MLCKKKKIEAEWRGSGVPGLGEGGDIKQLGQSSKVRFEQELGAGQAHNLEEELVGVRVHRLRCVLTEFSETAVISGISVAFFPARNVSTFLISGE